MSATDRLTTEDLIRWLGERSYISCPLCKGRNVWHVDGDDGKPPAKLCSWCDIAKERRFSGVNFPRDWSL